MPGLPLSISTKYQIIDLLYISDVTSDQFKQILRQVINYLQMLNGANHKILCNQTEIIKLQQTVSSFITTTLGHSISINSHIAIHPNNEIINLLRDWIESPLDQSKTFDAMYLTKN